MSDMQQVPAGHPLMKAWAAYKETEDFANTRRWAVQHPKHVDGSLWAAFMAGWNAAAAPELVEALRRFVTFDSTAFDCRRDRARAFLEVKKEARALLARTRGEES